jgi:hypothetical protein
LPGQSLSASASVAVCKTPQLWRFIAELFDNYLLACWVLFGGVTLEALAWRDDCVPHRLRSALLRITTSEGCKYKAAVRGSRARFRGCSLCSKHARVAAMPGGLPAPRSTNMPRQRSEGAISFAPASHQANP